MSALDPVTTLAELDRPVAPRGDFADALLVRCLAELERPRARVLPLPRRRVLRAALVLAAFLVVVGAATATYLATRNAAPAPPREAALTIVVATGGSMNARATIAAVGPHGALRTLWRCPERWWCGDLTGLAWSPDGKHLAFTVDEIGGTSGYVGLHIVDVVTGKDVQLPTLHVPHISRPQPMSFFRTYRRAAKRQLGCDLPAMPQWIGGGARLVYHCSAGLFSLRPDGTDRRRIPLPRGLHTPNWITVSPDGKQIAYASGPSPHYEVHHRVRHSAVYVAALDGSSSRLIAHDASSPSWSSDGTTLAYDSSCGGIRLATPDGADVTPGAPGDPCRTIGVRGRPVWSPDGTELAIGGRDGVWVVGADGGGLRRATSDTGKGILGASLPAWTPGIGHGRLLERRPGSGL